jgi:membrane protease YdiL (CAAX protease family)
MFDPERRRRQSADGPAWLYAPAGNLRSPWRLLVFALLLFATYEIVPVFIVPVFAQLSRWMGEPIAAYSWIMLAAVLAAVVLALRVVDHAPWSALSFDASGWRPRKLLIGWVLGSTVIGITALVLAVGGYLHFEVVSAPMIDGVESSFLAAWSATALRLLVLLAPAALWEELVFRGYLWTVAEDAGGELLALGATSVAFGVIHLLNPNAGVRTTVLVMLAGVCLGLLRMRLGLPAAWLAHLAWNWVMAAVLHVPVSGVGFATPGYRAEVEGPSWLTGGDWGPEGGLVAATVLSASLMIAERKRARHWRDEWSGVERRRSTTDPDSHTERS